jgi:hypothetical protein
MDAGRGSLVAVVALIRRSSLPDLRIPRDAVVTGCQLSLPDSQ